MKCIHELKYDTQCSNEELSLVILHCTCQANWHADSSVSCLHTSNKITDVCYYMKLFYVSCGFKFTTELTIYPVSEYSS